MTDRELLELAAKAAGHGEVWYLDGTPYVGQKYKLGGPVKYQIFNPLADDGDALRLAVKLGIMICRRKNINGQFAVAEAEGQMFCPEPWFPDPYAATRRAIVRAAAEIGRDMK